MCTTNLGNSNEFLEQSVPVAEILFDVAVGGPVEICDEFHILLMFPESRLAHTWEYDGWTFVCDLGSRMISA